MKKAIALFFALFFALGMASAQDMITLTVEADSTGWGTVTGGGAYSLNDTATIEAFPNPGCAFLYWNDSITDNPLDIIVTQDSTFIAHFSQIDYIISTSVAPENAGTVAQGGTYHYGDTITLEAIPSAGFVFKMWSDSVASNPRDVVVTESQTFTAVFVVRQCAITAIASPSNAGYVDGGGTYDYGDTISLFAQSNTGHYFEKWDDGTADNPRQVIVEDDVTFTAVFMSYEYQITTASQPVEGGQVLGGGTYHYGDTVTLRANPSENYTFICWQDGLVTNPRDIIVTEDAFYKALFQHGPVTTYTINVTANDPTLGTVDGGGEFPEGSIIEISATPSSYAVFTGWDDGNTENPRSIEVTEDMDFIAIFEALPLYTITVEPQAPSMGTTYGSGLYPAQSVITIGATPNEGYHFEGWLDGDTNNPRSIVVTEDLTYVALFAATPVETFSVTVYYDESQGLVLGANTSYPAGSIASLAAIPADDYIFVKWSDDTTDNPKEILVDHDIVLAAFFNYTDVDENRNENAGLYPNPATDKLHILGLDGRHEIQIYNALGMLVKTASLNENSEIDITDLMAGFYLLRVDGHAMGFVKK